MTRPLTRDGEAKERQAARYIVARYIRSGLSGTALRRKVERHAALLRGTEPELAEALVSVSLREVRRLVSSAIAEQRRWRSDSPQSRAARQAAVVAGICASEEA